MSGTTSNPTRFWQTLSGRFLLTGGMVMSLAAAVVGLWVSHRIEQGVVQNSAISSALYMESFISPLSQELADEEGLSEQAAAALQEIFSGTALGERVVSYKIWKSGGRIVEASDPSVIGRTFEPSPQLKEAWSGRVAASFEDLETEEDAAEAAMGIPLLEVYTPIREVWTGEIIAIAEFYERADVLAAELATAKRTSWLVVITVFSLSGLLLYGIVHAGGRLIERQRSDLEKSLVESHEIARQNIELKLRVMRAAQRTTAQSDRVMQRIGQDLHDGVAQYLSLASLRFDETEPRHAANSATVKHALETAMSELRAISRGLALPDIDKLELAQCIRRAVEDHEKAFHTDVQMDDLAFDLPHQPYSRKICVYRFVQEALSNAARHANAGTLNVTASTESALLKVTVRDNGIGFDKANAMTMRADGGQGLLGLADRAETLNGRIEIDSAVDAGTTIALILPIEDDQE